MCALWCRLIVIIVRFIFLPVYWVCFWEGSVQETCNKVGVAIPSVFNHSTSYCLLLHVSCSWMNLTANHHARSGLPQIVPCMSLVYHKLLHVLVILIPVLIFHSRLHFGLYTCVWHNRSSSYISSVLGMRLTSVSWFQTAPTEATESCLCTYVCSYGPASWLVTRYKHC